jgi:hypothetical protein
VLLRGRAGEGSGKGLGSAVEALEVAQRALWKQRGNVTVADARDFDATRRDGVATHASEAAACVLCRERTCMSRHHSRAATGLLYATLGWFRAGGDTMGVVGWARGSGWWVV